MRTLFFLLTFFCVLACNKSDQQAEAATSQETTDPAEVQNPANIANGVEQPTQQSSSPYPSIPMDRLEYLWNNSNYMDVVFYQLPVSLNQSSQDQVRSTLMGVGQEVPYIDPTCQSVGRIFFQVAGENKETAEIYFQDGCTFYLWLDDGKPAFANLMTEAGVNFYNNIIQQVQGGGQ
ncbi:MAG: hypothetical protein AAF741_06500 [Bacteroidota bacterium]